MFLKYSFQELESVFVQHTAFPWVSASPSLRFPPLRTVSSVPSAASLASQQWITYFKRSHLKTTKVRVLATGPLNTRQLPSAPDSEAVPPKLS